MRLFHYSEEPDIQIFEPRPNNYHDFNVVWAVGEAVAVNFLTPRDCPRITYGIDAHTSAADRERWMSHSATERVIAIESAWLDRLRRCTLYEYEMPSASFVLEDAPAAHYISRQIITPIHRRVISDLLGELASRNVELRVLPSLWPLRDCIAASTLRFSIYRMRNAQPPIHGYVPVIPA